MLLYLVRHGQTVSNTLNLITGSKEDPLTRKGEEQASKIGQCIESFGINFSEKFCSPWARAQSTASLAFPNVKFISEARIGETWAGDVATLTRDEFDKKFPDFFTSFSPDVSFVGGESHTDLYDRTIEWLIESAADHKEDGRILAVTHMGPISCILQYCFSIPMTKFPFFHPDNASLSVLFFPHSGHVKNARLLQYNFYPSGMMKISF